MVGIVIPEFSLIIDDKNLKFAIPEQSLQYNIDLKAFLGRLDVL